MSNACLFENFGDLYRAAYAEVDPITKQVLLAQVKSELDRWKESAGDEPASTLGTTSFYLPIGRAA